MPNHRVSWEIGSYLEVLPDGSIAVYTGDDPHPRLIVRDDAQKLCDALVRALSNPRRFCPDCASSAVTPDRETIYDEGPGSECRACGWSGPTAELREA